MSKNVNEYCFKCSKDFTEDDDVVYCPDCKKHYHLDCWVANNGCANKSCPSLLGESREEKMQESEGNNISNVTNQPVENTCNSYVSKTPAKERTILKTEDSEGKRSIFFTSFFIAIGFFVIFSVFSILYLIDDQEWIIYVSSSCQLVALVFAIVAFIMYHKALCVTITNKRVIFTTVFNSSISITLDLITSVKFTSFGKGFKISSANAKGLVFFHNKSEQYYKTVNELILDRQSNIL